MNAIDLAWLAGLLEGEGCFLVRNGRGGPLVQLNMVDGDIVARAAEIMGGRSRPWHAERWGVKKTQTAWRVRIEGSKALGLMDELYPLLGIRRRARIDACRVAWPKKTAQPRSVV